MLTGRKLLTAFLIPYLFFRPTKCLTMTVNPNNPPAKSTVEIGWTRSNSDPSIFNLALTIVGRNTVESDRTVDTDGQSSGAENIFVTQPGNYLVNAVANGKSLNTISFNVVDDAPVSETPTSTTSHLITTSGSVTSHISTPGAGGPETTSGLVTSHISTPGAGGPETTPDKAAATTIISGNSFTTESSTGWSQSSVAVSSKSGSPALGGHSSQSQIESYNSTLMSSASLTASPSSQGDPSPTSPSSQHSSDKRGIIIGLTIGILAFLAIFVIMLCLLRRKRRRRSVTFYRERMVRYTGPTLFPPSHSASLNESRMSGMMTGGEKDRYLIEERDSTTSPASEPVEDDQPPAIIEPSSIFTRKVSNSFRDPEFMDQSSMDEEDMSSIAAPLYWRSSLL